MTAILSCTMEDLYLFNLPFAVYSWHKIGIKTLIFLPDPFKKAPNDKLLLATRVIRDLKIGGEIALFNAPADKEATYAQCARLYAASIDGMDISETLITSDADMCVFNAQYWNQFHGAPGVTVIGRDLVPEGQYPMCYVSMNCELWHEVMNIRLRPLQVCLDELLGGIECENFRGNYWAKDQETIYRSIDEAHRLHRPGANILRCVDRAAPGTQFATRRADRDGWVVTPDIIDAHLPRPGYTGENIEKILSLFQTMYPEDNHSWMYAYWKEYLNLMGNE